MATQAKPTLLQQIDNSQFPQFLYLPAELRLMIWRFAAQGRSRVKQVWNNDKQRMSLRRPVPALLHVCQESRDEYLHQGREPDRDHPYKYDLVRGEDNLEPGEHCVFVNWKKDEIFLARPHVRHCAFYKGLFENLRFLVMDWDVKPNWVLGRERKGIKFCQKFPKLQTVTLLHQFKPDCCLADIWPKCQDIGKEKKAVLRRINASVHKAEREAALENPTWRRFLIFVVEKK